MAIISAGYPRISPDRPASIDAIQWAKMAGHLGSDYWVGGETDWRVRAVTGADRTLSVGTGQGGGRGVMDEITEAEHVQVEPLNSGTRWDTVVARRDWANAQTSMVAVRGGTSRAIRRENTEPGGVDDQPIAMVQLQAVSGGIRIGTIAHVAPRVGPGGMIVHHPEAMAYLDKPGTRVWVTYEGKEYLRTLSTTGSPQWTQTVTEDTGLVSPASRFSGDGRWWQHGSMVSLTGYAQVNESGLGQGYWWQMYRMPAGRRPGTTVRGVALSRRTSGGLVANRGLFQVEIGTDGVVRLYNNDPDRGVVAGTTYHFNVQYRQVN